MNGPAEMKLEPCNHQRCCALCIADMAARGVLICPHCRAVVTKAYQVS